MLETKDVPKAKEVAKPPIAITRPAPTSASKPRLPSVIVDPSAVETTQDRSAAAARAAAITRAPSQPRQPSAVQRRPAVPPRIRSAQASANFGRGSARSAVDIGRTFSCFHSATMFRIRVANPQPCTTRTSRMGSREG